ncbi:MAG TPA: thioredoxin-like (seleno)protein SaoT [Syntrophorhabdaceae bacterium]|nr:thioredoxin-like (seleno)protein SaoT [Syntrophorhabdaceae bacterium]
MAKVRIEFINTCAHCAETGRLIRQTAAGYGDAVEMKEYVAGKDFDYLKKYGMISKGTMIINEKVKYDNLSKEIIEKAIKEAIQEERNG